MKFFKFILAILRWTATKIDELIFGRSYDNYVGAGTILNIPFYSAMVVAVVYCCLNIAGHHPLPLGYSVIYLQSCACCISIAVHYKHYFNMPNLPLKIGYFIFLSVLSFVSGILFMLMFIYLLVIVICILVVLIFLYALICSKTRVREKYWWEA